MSAIDTSLGGPGKAFPETTGGLVSRLRGPDPAGFRAGLEDLCRRYWKPVYAYIRGVMARGNEDSKDLAQAFFLWLLEEEALRSFDPERGGFRRYLKLLLHRYVVRQDVAHRRLKRGGALALVPLSGDRDLEGLIADPRSRSPDELFDRMWIAELVRGAVTRVQERCASKGRTAAFRVYEEYDLAEGGPQPTYAGVAAKLGLSENQVRFNLFDIREEVRSEVRRELAGVAADDDELESEWHELFGG